MKPFTIYPDNNYPRDAVRPNWCYADGQLEKDLAKDMGEYGVPDYFKLSATFHRAIVGSEGKNYVKEGTYKCQYKGRLATLYVINSSGESEGLCCYDDDEESIEYIKKWLTRRHRIEFFPTTKKMENNRQKHNEIIREMKQELISRHYQPLIAAEIYGKQVYLKEVEVRALQVLAAKKAQESEDAWNEFCANVVVYSGRWKGRSYRMHWNKSGYFVENFPEGYFDVCGRLQLTLMKYEREKRQNKE